MFVVGPPALILSSYRRATILQFKAEHRGGPLGGACADTGWFETPAKLKGGVAARCALRTSKDRP
jgi:hypothetical protein